MSEYDPKQAVAMADARDAVIEAAKALHEAWMEEWDPSDPRLHPVHVRFKLAVDEMLTVKGDYCKGHASAGVDARVVTIDDAGNAVCPTCRKPKGDAERAVIEAAKAWCNEAAEEMEWIKNNPNPNVRVNPFLLRIYLNTKALLEAEGEE